MTQNIEEPTDVISAVYDVWKTNRDVIAGERAVKKGGTRYLSGFSGQTPEDYQAFLQRTPFFAGAARTHIGFLGLVTRKKGVLEVPAGLEDIFETITHDGHNVDDLAEEIFSETLITNYTGLLIDQVTPPVGMSLADAEKGNYRPFIATYQAESILEVTQETVMNKRAITRVRLLEGNDTVRELVLRDGIYQQIVHRNLNGTWTADAPIIPVADGQPLTEIPFILVTSKARNVKPLKGYLDDICLLNLHLYREQADAKNSRFYSSAPILTILGSEAPKNFKVGPGTLVAFPTHTRENPVEFKYTEFSGAGQDTLEKAVATYKDEMAKLGSNMLASEKNATEAAETHAIRRASENSILASQARTVSRQIEEALRWVAWWTKKDEKAVKFSLNTDFVPQAMSAQERTAALAELMSGAISLETFWEMCRAGEVLPDSFDPDAERQRIAVDSAMIDRPASEPIPAE